MYDYNSTKDRRQEKYILYWVSFIWSDILLDDYEP